MLADSLYGVGPVEQALHEGGTDLQGVPLHVPLASDLTVGDSGQQLLQAMAKLQYTHKER